MGQDKSRGCGHVDVGVEAPISVKLNEQLYFFCGLECLARWSVEKTAHYDVRQLDNLDHLE